MTMQILLESMRLPPGLIPPDRAPLATGPAARWASTYVPTVDALGASMDRHWKEWYEDALADPPPLEHRDAIRDQALGAAYATPNLDVPARYEVHLDRKLERTLAMLVRLRELRQSAAAA